MCFTLKKSVRREKNVTRVSPTSGIPAEEIGGIVVPPEIRKTGTTTMLIATHRRFMVEEVATHVAVMEEGRIMGIYEKKKALKMRNVQDLLF